MMAHVVAADQYFGGSIVGIFDDQPPIARTGARGIEDAPARPAEAWYRILVEQREALFVRVLAVDSSTAPEARIEHPMFGPLSWRETLLFTRLHDLDHAGQLGKIAAALGAGAARPA